MTNVTKTFVCEEHQDYGILGWREIDKDHFEPLAGIAVAHDCLEHFPDDGPAIEHEIQAFGAMLHVRGSQMGNGYRTSPWWESSQSGLLNVFHIYRYQGVAFHKPPNTHKLSNEEGEYQIAELLAAFPGFLESELSSSADNEDEREEDRQQIQTFVSYLRGWLRIGYRRAVQRWRKETIYIQPLFYDLQSRADKALKQAEIGEQFVVSVNMRKLQVVTKHQTLDDLYPDQDNE